MDQHDVMLATYASLHHIKTLEEKVMKEIAAGKDASERRKKAQQEAEEAKRKEQEDGRYDGLVEILRYGGANAVLIAQPTRSRTHELCLRHS